MDLEKLFAAISGWGIFHEINNPDKQGLKLLEESGELAHELCRGRYDSDKAKDAIGDIMVVTIILANILGFDPKDCLEMAYNEIYDRIGDTLEGCFVKEEK